MYKDQKNTDTCDKNLALESLSLQWFLALSARESLGKFLINIYEGNIPQAN